MWPPAPTSAVHIAGTWMPLALHNIHAPLRDHGRRRTDLDPLDLELLQRLAAGQRVGLREEVGHELVVVAHRLPCCGVRGVGWLLAQQTWVDGYIGLRNL